MTLDDNNVSSSSFNVFNSYVDVIRSSNVCSKERNVSNISFFCDCKFSDKIFLGYNL